MPSLIGGGKGAGVGAGKGAGAGEFGIGVGRGVGKGVGAVFVLGMGAYTGSLMGFGNGTFEVTGAGVDKPGVGMIIVEVGGMVCVSTEGALRR